MISSPTSPPGAVAGADDPILIASKADVLFALDPVAVATRWTLDSGVASGNDLSRRAAVLADGSIIWPGSGGVVTSPSGEFSAIGGDDR